MIDTIYPRAIRIQEDIRDSNNYRCVW